jgi:hypothetical protein
VYVWSDGRGEEEKKSATSEDIETGLLTRVLIEELRFGGIASSSSSDRGGEDVNEKR